MALIPEITHGKIKHVMGDQFLIPVTLNLKDGATEVFSHTIQIKHNSAKTIAQSIGEKEVIYDLQKAIDSHFSIENVKAKEQEITNALELLKKSLEILK